MGLWGYCVYKSTNNSAPARSCTDLSLVVLSHVYSSGPSTFGVGSVLYPWFRFFILSIDSLYLISAWVRSTLDLEIAQGGLFSAQIGRLSWSGGGRKDCAEAILLLIYHLTWLQHTCYGYSIRHRFPHSGASS